MCARERNAEFEVFRLEATARIRPLPKKIKDIVANRRANEFFATYEFINERVWQQSLAIWSFTPHTYASPLAAKGEGGRRSGEGCRL